MFHITFCGEKNVPAWKQGIYKQIDASHPDVAFFHVKDQCWLAASSEAARKEAEAEFRQKVEAHEQHEEEEAARKYEARWAKLRTQTYMSLDQMIRLVNDKSCKLFSKEDW